MSVLGDVLDDVLELPIALLLPPSREPWWSRWFPARLMKRERVLERRVHEGTFQRALSMIAGVSGLLAGLEVSLQHYRGSYNQRIMYSPVLLSLPLFAAGTLGALSRRVARTALPIASLAMLADGVVGFGFHVRGIARKPGGFRIPVANIVMGPPIFAPLLLGIGGFLGVVASLLRREDDPLHRTRVGSRWEHLWHHGVDLLEHPLRARAGGFRRRARNGRLQGWLAAVTAVSAVLNGAESLYSHYKSGFRRRAQWIPVVLSPVIALTAGGAMVSGRVARRLLPAVSLLAIAAGGVGFFYHARGVARRPGGVKMPLYNLVYGPPALAPLLFAATGFLGLLSSQLRRAHT